MLISLLGKVKVYEVNIMRKYSIIIQVKVIIMRTANFTTNRPAEFILCEVLE